MLFPMFMTPPPARGPSRAPHLHVPLWMIKRAETRRRAESGPSLSPAGRCGKQRGVDSGGSEGCGPAAFHRRIEKHIRKHRCCEPAVVRQFLVKLSRFPSGIAEPDQPDRKSTRLNTSH